MPAGGTNLVDIPATGSRLGGLQTPNTIQLPLRKCPQQEGRDRCSCLLRRVGALKTTFLPLAHGNGWESWGFYLRLGPCPWIVIREFPKNSGHNVRGTHKRDSQFVETAIWLLPRSHLSLGRPSLRRSPPRRRASRPLPGPKPQKGLFTGFNGKCALGLNRN